MGELKDGKLFKGTAMVTITEWKAKHGWKWNYPGWLNSDQDVDHWWNQERETLRIGGKRYESTPNPSQKLARKDTGDRSEESKCCSQLIVMIPDKPLMSKASKPWLNLSAIFADGSFFISQRACSTKAITLLLGCILPILK